MIKYYWKNNGVDWLNDFFFQVEIRVGNMQFYARGNADSV